MKACGRIIVNKFKKLTNFQAGLHRVCMVGCRLILAFILLNGHQMAAQNTIGLPGVTHFTEQDFQAGVQNWMITQDRFGIMYFANTDGLLTFNGNDWQLFPLPNKTLVRSVMLSADGKIFVGGQDELGYFFPDANGRLRYHSLKMKIPAEHRSFADVWNVCSDKGKLFFRCTDRIFVMDTATYHTEVYLAPSEWSFMGVAGGMILAQDKKQGLRYYVGHQWHPFTHTLTGMVVTGTLEAGKDSMIITTLKHGVFLSHLNAAGKPLLKKIRLPAIISSSHIYTAIAIKDSTFALGTTSDGVYIINVRGDVVRHFNSSTRLQNNNVLSLYVDKETNLWLGLDKGIDLVDYNSFIQTISPVTNTPAACYTATIFQDKLYIGTSDGLYETKLNQKSKQDLSFSTQTFTRVANSGGQVWGLYGSHHQLLMGHNEGIYKIQDQKALPVYKEEGTWLFKGLPGDDADGVDLIAGNYAGMHLLRIRDGELTDAGRVPGSPYESLRFMAIDSVHSIIWASHPYRGVFKMQMSKDMRRVLSTKLYTEKEGLPNHLNNYVYQVGAQILFCTDLGVYTYQATKDRFVPDKKYKALLGNLSLRMVVADSAGNTWFVTHKKLGVVNHKSGKVQYFPEVTGKLISGFEFIYPLNEKNIFVGSNDGLIHINFDKYQQKQEKMHLLLSKVVAIADKDSVLFNGYYAANGRLLDQQSPEAIPRIKARFNSFHFEYTTTVYREPGDLQYAFQLAGFDKQWSKWSARKEKDYTNLPYGSYTFKIKCRGRLGSQSGVSSYTFIIEPHWYQTTLAYLLYLLVFLGVLIWLRHWQQKKFEQQRRGYEQEQAQLQYLHQLEIEHSEREILNLQKEKLETEVAYKNQELASTTMHLFKRGKLLAKLKTELLEAIKHMPASFDQRDFSKLVKMLNEAEKQDGDWEQFAIHFDEVHNNFLKNLKAKFPELTPSDLKICAYLKMNLSSKEIAQLLNISLKGVEVARYRLRKKLNMASSQINLYDFLIEKGDGA